MAARDPDEGRFEVRALSHLKMATACASFLLAGLGGPVACGVPPVAHSPGASDFDEPERVTIQGYAGHAMEPFIARDGQFLFFNNLNHPSENTNLHYAERLDDTTFAYRGEIAGVNTTALEGVPTMDRANAFYFVSPRSYGETMSTIYRGVFSSGRVSGVELVPGISKKQAGIVNFDVEVSPDGNTLYFVDSDFAKEGPQTADIVVAQRRGSSFERSSNSDLLMANINSGALEYAPCISADGLTLFFTRADKGLLGRVAILVATRSSISTRFDEPIVLSAIDGFVEGPTLSPDERSLYYHRKDGDRFVIYRATWRRASD